MSKYGLATPVNDKQSDSTKSNYLQTTHLMLLISYCLLTVLGVVENIQRTGENASYLHISPCPFDTPLPNNPEF